MEYYQDILMNAPIGIFVSSPEGRFLSVNKAMARMYGFSEPLEMIWSITDIVNHIYLYPEDRREFQRRLERDGEIVNFECQVRCRDGEIIWVSTNARVVRDNSGNTTLYQGYSTDITERKQFEERLKYLSLHDQLTGLYNRAYLENELQRLNSSREYPISIISVDLDGLKLVNDTLGHDHGDDLLKVCAWILQESFRDSDIIARAGGDEFVILLPGTELHTGEKIVQRIQLEIKNYNQLHKGQIPLSLSIGLACADNEQPDLNEVLKQADDFMYQDKLNSNMNSRSQIMAALMAALEERDFIASGHAHRLQELCLKLGKEMGLSVNQISNLNLLVQVHDLGKVGIPDKILFKPGPLTEAEWEIMCQHPEKGYRIALASPDMAGIADLILKHHERWDGQGYPLGLQGEEIPVECRILAIADSFDSMVNDRPYRKAMSCKDAVQELRRCAGSQFDLELVEKFIHVLQKLDSE